MKLYILPNVKAYIAMKIKDELSAGFVGYWHEDKLAICKDVLTGTAGVYVPAADVAIYLEAYSK